MKRRFLSGLLGLALAAATLLVPNAALAADPVKVNLDGQALTFDVAPRLIDGNTMLPVRAIAEALGFTVTPNGNVITLEKGSDTVVLTVGSAEIEINGAASQLATPVVLIEGRTLVHLRAFEQLGFNVAWEGATSTVQISNAYTVDEAALALLLKEAAVEASVNYDIEGTASLKLGGDLGELGPMLGLLGDLKLTIAGQARGEDMLMNLTMPDFADPTGPAMELGIATKGGKVYMKLPAVLAQGTGWEVLEGGAELGAAAFDPAAVAEMIKAFADAVVSATLGKTEAVDGVTHQWIHLIIDASKFAAEAGVPLGKVNIDVLVNPETGEAAKLNFGTTIKDEEMTMDLSVTATMKTAADGSSATSAVVKAKATAEGETFEVELHFDLTTKPNDAPIEWPAELAN